MKFNYHVKFGDKYYKPGEEVPIPETSLSEEPEKKPETPEVSETPVRRRRSKRTQ